MNHHESVLDPHRHPQRRAVLVGLEPGGAYAVRGELLVAFLRVAGDADGAYDFAAASRISMPPPSAKILPSEAPIR